MNATRYASTAHNDQVGVLSVKQPRTKNDEISLYFKQFSCPLTIITQLEKDARRIVTDLVTVSLFSSKIVSFHQNWTTLRKLGKRGTKWNQNPQFEVKKFVQKTSKYHTQFNAQLCRMWYVPLSFVNLLHFSK